MLMNALHDVFEGFEALKDCHDIDSEIQPIGSKSPLARTPTQAQPLSGNFGLTYHRLKRCSK
jgi:hypothetical protein